MRRFYLALLGLAGLASAGGYLAPAFIAGREFGFPLDDAWIHQVYARNLGTGGGLAFFPGQPSGGSTSPLWTLLLSLGYLLRLNYPVWTLFLGVGFAVAAAYLGGRLGNRLGAALGLRVSGLIIALLILLEWHLTWAADSGMEIPLFVFLSLLSVDLQWEARPAWMIGAAIGLLTVTRPEGLVLGAVLAAAQVPERIFPRQRPLTWLALFALGLLAPVLPYLAFNLTASGTIWPNTFYAKSEEYAYLGAEPYISRWLTVALQPVIGVQVILLPGLAWCLRRVWRMRGWFWLGPLIWVPALISLYAWRLPVAYQHGRYLMPAIPFLLIYGWVGVVGLAANLPRILRRTWYGATAALAAAFWVVGAGFYTTDVAIINCEMVQTARWTAAHLSPDGLIAAHDIGAQGYFGLNPILDLAGIVTPEIIPFIRDQARVRDFMLSRGARHVVVFPSWYPEYSADPGLRPVYTPDCRVTQTTGGDSLVVYEVVR